MIEQFFHSDNKQKQTTVSNFTLFVGHKNQKRQYGIIILRLKATINNCFQNNNLEQSSIIIV